jgi:hypothetical protein
MDSQALASAATERDEPELATLESLLVAIHGSIGCSRLVAYRRFSSLAGSGSQAGS